MYNDFKDNPEWMKNNESLNKKRLEALERMGTKWILHPQHYIQKKDVPENTLGFKTA